MAYRVTKTYGHELGLSAVFRQWRAKSHCNQLHGYALSFELTFEADTLNEQGWVIDFGGLATIKEMLKRTFDHTTVVSRDDPHLAEFQRLGRLDLLTLRILDDGVGCERFAKHVYDFVQMWLRMGAPPTYALYQQWLDDCLYFGHLENSPRIVAVKCSEHGANSAIYKSRG